MELEKNPSNAFCGTDPSCKVFSCSALNSCFPKKCPLLEMHQNAMVDPPKIMVYLVVSYAVDPVPISYLTVIRDLMYHINTAAFCSLQVTTSWGSGAR